MGTRRPVGSWSRELALAARSLARDRGFSGAAILALGLGVGLTGAAFSITWGTVLKDLPFERPHELVHLSRADDDFDGLAVTPHDYVAWRGAQRSFIDLAAYTEVVMNLTGEGGFPARVGGAAMEPRAFELLGVAPALGRALRPDDDRPGAPDVVVLAHDLWSARYGSDPGIVGRDVVLNGRPHTVVGVMPRGFGFPLAEQIWVPLRLELADHEPGSGRLDAFGRLREGVGLEEARREFHVISRELAERRPGTNAGIRANLQLYTDEYVGDDFQSVVLGLLGGSLLVLLVSCLNVANLMLVRGVRRAREMAIRVSLGAGRAALLRVVVAEGVVLAAAAAVVGTPLAAAGVRWFAGTAGQPGTFQLAHGGAVPFWWDVGLDGSTLLFILAGSLLTLVLAGVVPALRVWRTDPNRFLRDPSRQGSGRTSPVIRAVVAAEVAVALAVLSVSLVMTGTLLEVNRVGDGFRTEGITAALLPLPDRRVGADESAFPDVEARRLLWERTIARLEAEPGVARATVSTAPPFLGSGVEPVRIPGRTVRSGGEDAPIVRFGVAGPGFFEMLGVRPEAGRLFDAGDRAGAEPVVVVNRSFVERFFPGDPAVGASVALTDGGERGEPGSGREVLARIVGVVPDLAMAAVGDDEQAGLYRPLAQAGRTNRTDIFDRRELRYAWLLVESTGGGAGAATALRTVAAELTPGIPLTAVGTLDRARRRATGEYRLYGTFYLVFGASALFLSLVGLYGVVAYSVGNRTHEVGIRMALGAGSRRVLATVLRGTMIQLAVGIAAGLLLSLWVTSTLRLAVVGADPGDPRIVAGAAALLVATGVVAAWIPARRATRIDPVRAFRAE